MPKLMLVLEYDGTAYHGFQIQPGLPTIQGELEKALGKLTGEAIRVVAASRTDAGAHALGQVVSFQTSSHLTPSRFVGGLNFYLPEDIAVKSARRVGEGFHARRSAVSREYRYSIYTGCAASPLRRRRMCWFAPLLDLGAVRAACEFLVGRKDFASFASSLGTRESLRTMQAVRLLEEEETLHFEMMADSFLPHQVRNTAGCLLGVGVGKTDVEGFCNILERREPGLAGPTLPAYGLYLMRVNYPPELLWED